MSKRVGRPQKAGRNTPTAGSLKNDLLQWFQSLRFSALSALIVALALTGAVVLTPSISIYMQQQREIAQLRESVELHRKSVSEIEAEQLKWQDPIYIRAQARDRLYYVMPGEIQLAVLEEGVVIPVDPVEDVSPKLTQSQQNWAKTLVTSTLQSGTTDATPQQFNN